MYFKNSVKTWFVFKDCQYELLQLIGDGYCNDETNNRHCAFDHQDCCGSSCVIKERCERCECLTGIDPNNKIANVLVGNGFCNDETNSEDCNFDGGDCCGSCKLTGFCKVCECVNTTAVNSINPLPGNGVCNDESNIPSCNYDNFECCGPYVGKIDCVHCQCHQGMYLHKH